MRKLCWGTGAFAAALALAHYVIPAGWLWIFAAFCALCALLALCFPKGGNAQLRVLLLSLCAAVGFGWYGLYGQLFLAPAEAFAGETVTLDARVLDYPTQGEGYSSVTVRLTSEGLPRVRAQLSYYDGTLPPLRPGDTVSASVKLTSAGLRAGEATDSWYSRGIALRGYLKAAPTVTGRAEGAWRYFPQELAHLVKSECARVFPADMQGFLKSLMTGDKTELYADDGLYVSLQRAGILHVAAVSGMHLSFLYGCIHFLCLKRRRLSAAVSIPLLWLFVLMTGVSPSAVRAAVMLTLVMMAPFLRREADGITSLCAAAAPLLVLNPCAIGSASLQLSFAAMAGIILVSPRVYRWCEGKWKAPPKGKRHRLRAFVIASAASSLGAVVFTAPLTAARFGGVAILSPLTNLLTLWAVSLCFLGGYGAVLLGTVWLPLGKAAGWLAGWAARFVALICKGISALPFAVVNTGERLGAAWLLLVYALFLIAWLRRGEKPFRPVAPACLSLIALCAVLMAGSLSARGTTFTALDVGQGQCLAVLSQGSAVLVDCGGESAGDTAAAYLQSRGRGRVDALILTHLHSDHAGGVQRLMARMDVELLLLPEDVRDADGILPELLAAAERRGTRVEYVSELTTLTAGDAVFTLFPPTDAGLANERGLLALCSVGDWDCLITGDSNTTVEKRLVSDYALPDCEALVVGHHGSRYSTSAELLDAIRPETAVLSVGYNSFGHPTPEILTRLFDRGITIYRTDENGNVTIRID